MIWLYKINEKENLNIKKSDIRSIQNIFKSDIRSMINFLQSNHSNIGLNINIFSKKFMTNLFLKLKN